MFWLKGRQVYSIVKIGGRWGGLGGGVVAAFCLHYLETKSFIINN